MSAQNEYRGFVKFPKKKPTRETVRLDFNGFIDSQPEGTKLSGISLRLSVLNKGSKDDQAEISITLRPEEWLDLIDAMKEEFESVQKARKNFDEMR
jgi:hypothetical protein